MKDEEPKNTAKEPIAEYDVKSYSSIEQLPIFGKVIEKSKQNHLEGKGISHEEATRKIKERYPFLK